MPQKTKMKEFTLDALAEIIKARTDKNIKGTFSGVSTDSRDIKAGDCFFAIAGENFDGHDFLEDVFRKGASCAVVSKKPKENLAGKVILKVKDAVTALGDLAAAYRRLNNFKVVAITGSVGKTTTRQIAYEVLRRHFKVHAAPKNFNNTIGLPLTLLGADEHEIILAELGTDHPGEIAYLSRIAGPDIAVVTTVAPAHLAGFGSVEAILEEKLSISQGLSRNGILIINGDNEQLVKTCRNKGLKFLSFGESADCDVKAREISYEQAQSRFTVNAVEIELPLPGPGNVKNALAAMAICRQFGLTERNFADAAKTLGAVAMRTELIRAGSVTIINDCYNANPASMKNALDILANFRASRGGKQGRLVFICGDMAELGGQSEALHARLGEDIAKAGVDVLLAVGKFAGIVTEAAKAKADYPIKLKCFKDTLLACNNLEKFVKNSDIILVKGSRASKLEKATERLRQLFEK